MSTGGHQTHRSPRHPRNAVARTAMVFALVVVSVFAMPTTAGAQRSLARNQVTLRIDAFTGAISPQGAFRLRVRLTNSSSAAQEDLRVVATFHRRAFHRLDFARAVDDGRVGDEIARMESSPTAVDGRRVSTVELRRTAQELGFAVGDDGLGVYPMVVRLQRGDTVLQTVRTAVVVITSEVVQPLRVAYVVSIAAPSALRPGGLLEPDGLRQDFAPSGRLRTLLSEAGGRADVPVTFAIDARVLDDAADFADGYQEATETGPVERDAASSVARAARGFLTQLGRTLTQAHVQTVAWPYGGADLVALTRGGMPSEAARLITEGRSRVEARTGARPVPGVLVPADGLSSQALAEAVGVGVDTVILQPRYLEASRTTSSSPASVRHVRTGTGTLVNAAVADPWLSEMLTNQRALAELDPVVAVQRLVAESAAVYFERPFAREPRGLVIQTPPQWSPPAKFAGGLAGALKAAPWLQPTTLTGLLEEVPPTDVSPTRVSYPQASRDNELPSHYVGELRNARRALGSLAGVLTGDHAATARFDRTLLTAAGTEYRDEQPLGRELLREVERTVRELYASVHLLDSPTVLLSGAEGQLPVTVENRSSIPLRLAIRLESQRFTFAGGDSRVVVVAGNSTQTIAFAARARARGGTFPVRVVVEDADGQLQLAEGTVVVRSTAVSAVALAVVIGAGAFLLLWWLRTVRKRRAHGRRHGHDVSSDAA